MNRLLQRHLSGLFVVGLLTISWFILLLSGSLLHATPSHPESDASPGQYQRVGLVSVSSQFDETLLGPICDTLTEQGYRVSDKHLEQVISDFGYVNTDQARANQLIHAMLDDNLDILWFVRGGGGGLNLLPYLEASKAQLKTAQPKILVGFSDVTAIHSFVNEQLGWPSVHGVVARYNRPMATASEDSISTNDLQPIPNVAMLWEHGVAYDHILPLNTVAQQGATGTLRGGNLTLVSSTFSTQYEPQYTNTILLLEDIGSSFRSLDRQLYQLLFKKDLSVNAIVFGQFYPLDPTDEQRLAYKSVIANFARRFDKPVYYYPQVGHGRYNHPLILGTQTTITCPQDKKNEYCTLRQQAPQP